ncbi:MAG: hypothetical protein ACK40X_02390 [Armatimonadota bacterium]
MTHHFVFRANFSWRLLEVTSPDAPMPTSTVGGALALNLCLRYSPH